MPVKGNYTSIFTNGWFMESGIYEDSTTTIEYEPAYPTVGEAFDDVSQIVSEDEVIGIIPDSGLLKEWKTSITYNSNTEWFYFDNPYPRLRAKQGMNLLDFHLF